MFLLLEYSWLFWLVIGADILLVAGFAVAEKVGIATGLLIASLLGFQFLTSNLHPLTWAYQHPIATLEYIAAYLAIGVVWVYPKWHSFIGHVYTVASAAKTEAQSEYDAEMKVWDDAVAKNPELASANFAYPKNMTRITKPSEPEYDLIMRTAVRDEFGTISKTGFVPNVAVNKARIMGWMMYWPASMIWTVINDPVRRFYEWAYRTIASSLQGMADRRFRDLTT